MIRLRPSLPSSAARLAAVGALVALVTGFAGPALAADMQGSLSIVAMDRAWGEIGVAVVSDAPACGAVVPWVEAGAGGIATQGEVVPGWGPRGLALLRQGMPVEEVCRALFQSYAGQQRTQLGILDRDGQACGTTGLELINHSGGRLDSTVAVTGNSISYTNALDAAADSFLVWRTRRLPRRMLDALAVGAIRTRGPLRSAALLVGRADPDRAESATAWISLRVDDSATPIADLEALYRYHAAARLVESHLHFADQFDSAAVKSRYASDRALATSRAAAERAYARSLFDAALANKSTDPQALNAMAWQLSQRNTWLDECAKAIMIAMKRQPDNRSFLDTAAEIAGRLGDMKSALIFAQQASVIGPRDPYLYERVKLFGGTPTVPGH